jgi:hypothetical protein
MSLELQHAIAWVVILGLPAAAFAAGALHQRFSRAALIAALTVAGSYALLLAVSGSWAASCWDCTSGANDPIMRKTYFTMALIWGGMFAVLVEGTIWLGVLISRLFAARLSTE